MSEITIEDYSDRAIVVRGEGTQDHKETLKSMGGKWNSRLRDGPGWIFPKTKKGELEKWKAGGMEVVRTQTPFSQSTPSLQPQSLERKVDEMNSRLVRIEKLLKTLTGEESDEEEEEVPRKRLLR